MSKVFKKIVPSTGSGTYTFQTNRRIVFQISGEGKASLREMRMCGNFATFTDRASPPTALAMADDVNINQWTGLHSIISKIKISSLKYSTKIAEEVSDYPRLSASLNAMLNSKADFDTELCHEEFSRGYGQPTEKDLPEVDPANVSNPMFNKSTLLQSRKHLIGNKSFSMRLLSGMLQSTDIDLQEIGGLNIEIDLNADSDVFFGTAANNANYQITNLELSLPVVVTGQPPRPNPDFDFLTFKSTHKNMTSTTTSLNDGNLTLGNVLGVLQNLTIQGYENNSATDGQALYNCGLRSLEYRLNGKRFPLNNPMLTNYDTNSTILHQLTTNSEVIRNACSSMTKYSSIDRTALDGNLLRGFSNSLGYGCFLMGCAFDQVSGMGVNFNGANFTTVSEQTLQSPDGIGTKDFRLYSHYLIRQTVSIQNNQIEIMI